MPKRCLLPVLLLTMLLAALTAAPSAMAVDPPTTTILTPADGTLANFNWQTHTGMISISGSTTGIITAVDIRCYYEEDGDYRNIVTNVPLDGGGNFSDENRSLSVIDGYSCWLVAVPTGTNPTIPSADFHGARLTVNTTGDSIDGGPAYDFFDFAGQANGSWGYDSLSDCGVSYGQLNNPTYNFASTYTFNCNQYIRNYKPSSASPEISGLQVNGLNAYGAYAFSNGAGDAGGAPSLVHSFSVNPITRDATITHTEGFSTCPANTTDPDGTSCPTASDTGITLSRTIQQNHSGLMARVTDVYKNNTSAPVTLNIAYSEDHYFGISSGASHLTHAFPNGGSFVDGAQFAQVNGPFASPSTIYTSDPSRPDGEASTGRGALTMFPGADSAVMGNNKGTYFLQYNNKVIPAGGTYRIEGVFAQAFGQSQLNGLAAEASLAITPQPTFGAKAKSSLKYNKKKKSISYVSGQSVLCPATGQACAIGGKLTAKVKLPAKKAKKGSKKKSKAKYKTYTLGKFNQTGAPGSATALNLKLGATAIKLFKQYGKLNTTFVVNVTAGPYATATNTFVAKLKSPKFPKPKQKKKH